MGATLFNRSTGEVLVLAKSWTPLERSRHINELEIMAIHQSLTHFEDVIGDYPVRIYIDNDAARLALTKGHSKSYHINLRLIESLPILRSKRVEMERIASALNPADEPSRNLEVSLQKVSDWTINSDITISSRTPNCVANNLAEVVQLPVQRPSAFQHKASERPVHVPHLSLSRIFDLRLTHHSHIPR
jgi:hypothetical protein